MWDLPGPGLEPVSPALAGGCLTTVPPGKPPFLFSNAKSFCNDSSPQEDGGRELGNEWPEKTLS